MSHGGLRPQARFLTLISSGMDNALSLGNGGYLIFNILKKNYIKVLKFDRILSRFCVHSESDFRDCCSGLFGERRL